MNRDLRRLLRHMQAIAAHLLDNIITKDDDLPIRVLYSTGIRCEMHVRYRRE